MNIAAHFHSSRRFHIAESTLPFFPKRLLSISMLSLSSHLTSFHHIPTASHWDQQARQSSQKCLLSGCVHGSLFSFSKLILLNTLDAHQLRLKHQDAVRRDRSDRLLAIAHLRRDCQSALLTDAHVEEAFIPSAQEPSQLSQIPTIHIHVVNSHGRTQISPLNDAPRTELERQRRAAAKARVELDARRLQRAGVVHVDGVALLGLALAFHRRRQVFDLQAFGRAEARER